MKSLLEYMKVEKWPSEPMIIEMATVARRIKIGKDTYKIAVHGPISGDRPNPHIHIYLYNDARPYNKFNFEISLCDILCKDEINIIKMRDESKHINKTGRDKCSWEGYKKLRDGIEDWLMDKSTMPGEFKNNLDACVYWYNQEGDHDSINPIRDYIKERGWKIHPKYKEYIDRNDVE